MPVVEANELAMILVFDSMDALSSASALTPVLPVTEADGVPLLSMLAVVERLILFDDRIVPPLRAVLPRSAVPVALAMLLTVELIRELPSAVNATKPRVAVT